MRHQEPIEAAATYQAAGAVPAVARCLPDFSPVFGAGCASMEPGLLRKALSSLLGWADAQLIEPSEEDDMFGRRSAESCGG